MSSTRCAAAVLSMAILMQGVGGSVHAQVTAGQVDDFEDGTTQGWLVNLLGMGSHPAPPENVPTGGPAGVDDNFLRLTALGATVVAGSRLSAINASRWAGDYLAAGIGAIAMDVANFGDTDLFLRIMFEDPTPTAPPANIAFSGTPFMLPAGSGWTRAVFPLFGPSGLIPGIGDVALALANATAMRIYHSEADAFPNPFVPIEPVVAQLGVDNIRALSTVPEPATLLLLAPGALGLLYATRRRQG